MYGCDHMNRLFTVNFSRSISFDKERGRNVEGVCRILSHRHYQQKRKFFILTTRSDHAYIDETSTNWIDLEKKYMVILTILGC